jgi:cell division protein ZapA (FtsZ GTPase activity inhibitor)
VSTPGRVDITVLGQKLTVRTEASPDYLRRLAAYLEERVSALTRSGMKDPLAAMTLAALDITDELFRSREDQNRQDGDVGQRIGALVEMLDRLAPGPAQPRRP